MTHLIRLASLALITLGASAPLASATDYIGGVPGVTKGIPVPQGGFGCGSNCGGGRTQPASGNAGSGGSGGYDAGPSLHTIKLACIVGGSPSALPNDIWITNTTNSALVAGTKLAFTVPSVGVKGSFLLPKTVPVGTQLKVADLFGGAPAGSSCTVRLIA